jgi:hypothetical protein
MTAYAINKVCWLVEFDEAFRERLRRDMPGVLAEFRLAPDEARAFEQGDVATLYRRGGHPFLLQSLARNGIAGLDRQLYRQRLEVVLLSSGQ